MNELQMRSKHEEIENESRPAVEQAGGPVAVPAPEPGSSGSRPTLRSLRAETEMHAISEALEQTGWNRKRAAQLLSISYRGLLYKIRQHNITPDQQLAPVPKRAKMTDPLDGWDGPGLAMVGGGMSRTPSKG
jgi:DNA-binding NtrC family response regulator